MAGSSQTVDRRLRQTPQRSILRDSRSGMDELYNLAEDPGELRSLIRFRGPDLSSTAARLESALRVQIEKLGTSH